MIPIIQGNGVALDIWLERSKEKLWTQQNQKPWELKQRKSLPWDCHRLSLTKRVFLNFLSLWESRALHLEDVIT